VPGALKNALDWIVGSGELVDKPVALLNASPRATLAQVSLTETIRVMSAYVVEEASLRIPLMGGTSMPPELLAIQSLHDSWRRRSPNSELRSRTRIQTRKVWSSRRFDALATLVSSP